MPPSDDDIARILDLEDIANSPLLSDAGRAFVAARLRDRRSGLPLWTVSIPSHDAISRGRGLVFGPHQR